TAGEIQERVTEAWNEVPEMRPRHEAGGQADLHGRGHPRILLRGLRRIRHRAGRDRALAGALRRQREKRSVQDGLGLPNEEIAASNQTTTLILRRTRSSRGSSP